MPFTRMDRGKVEDWMVIGQAVAQRQVAMPQMIRKLLGQLEEQVDGFAVNQLEHSLQTATRAVRTFAPGMIPSSAILCVSDSNEAPS